MAPRFFPLAGVYGIESVNKRDGAHDAPGPPDKEETQRQEMAVGNVKWFDPKKGYGFIQPEDGSKDVFITLAALKQAGLTQLKEGQKVKYKVNEGRHGQISASNLSELVMK